jgi:hypothetical protein
MPGHGDIVDHITYAETRGEHGDMRLIFALLILSIFGTCAITNATEDMALVACYEAGFSPSECER